MKTFHPIVIAYRYYSHLDPNLNKLEKINKAEIDLKYSCSYQDDSWIVS